MDENRRREIGLFRYALVRDSADSALSKVLSAVVFRHGRACSRC